MTNKEKYKQAFSTLHSSQTIILEDRLMKKNRMKTTAVKVAVAALAFGALFGTGNIVSYAMEGTSLVKTISVWINGEEKEMDIQFNEKTVDGKTVYEGSAILDSDEDSVTSLNIETDNMDETDSIVIDGETTEYGVKVKGATSYYEINDSDDATEVNESQK
ncbi:MAG: hypothetical protein Q4D51_09870 [Eubacteriales bacterium]|nr:hypothetical protein [Eubacteriales bacterium]